MPTTVSHPGRPLAATLATGLAGGAFSSLVLGETTGLPPGTFAASGLGLTVFFLIGTLWARRLPTGREPAGLLVPLLGLLGAALPASLLAERLGVHWIGPFAAMPGLAPAGLVLGLLATCCLAASRDHPRWHGRSAALAVILVGAAGFGALAAQGVLVRLSPLNLALDLTMGCAAMGIVCAAGTGQQRRHETWLSLLALTAILALPLSGLIDARTHAWSENMPRAAASSAPAPRPPVAPAP